MRKDERIYTAALVIIGNEILSGRTQDSNVQYTAENLTKWGVRLVEVRIVPDVEQKIVEAVNVLRNAVDYVLTTGGIGPTHDDITAGSMARAFGVNLVRHDGAYQRLLEHYGSEDELTAARLKMTMIPEGAVLIDNSVSGAPGFILENVYVMAGVPRIMHAMLDSLEGCLTGGAVVLSETVLCFLPESAIAEDLSALQDKYPDIDIGSYPLYRNGEHSTSLVLRGTDEALLQTAKSELENIVRDLDG